MTSDLERRLTEHAARSLSADPQRLAQLRADFLADLPIPTRARRAGFSLRRLVVLTAVALTLSTGVVLASSGPGQPLYGVRLTLDAWLAPVGGGERAAQLLEQLDHRLAEATAASQAGDASALADAMRAYSATMARLQGDGTVDDVSTEVLTRLDHQLSALANLLQQSDPANYSVVEGVIQDAQQTRDTLTVTPTPTGPPRETPAEGHSQPPAPRP